MRLKLITILSICLFWGTLFQQVAVAQNDSTVQSFPITSKGFGARLSPDGNKLVTFENILLLGLKEVDPALLPMKVINLQSGSQAGELAGFSDYVSDAAFSSDGSQLVTIHLNGELNIWDMATLKLLKTYQTPLLGYTPIRLFPDNQRALLQSLGTPQRLMVFDLTTGAITTTIGKRLDSYLDFQANYVSFPASGDLMYAGLALSPFGNEIATATANDEVGIWGVDNGAYVELRPKSEKPGLFSIRSLLYTPDGKMLIYYDASDKQTHIWDLVTRTEKSALAIGSDTMTLSGDGTKVAWATRSDGTISVASLDTPDEVTVLLTLPEGLQVAPRITWLAFKQGGRQLVAGGFFASDETANQIYVIDVPTA